MKATITDVYDQATLRKLQEMELEIFKKFIKICEKYDLTYFAIYGTLLGAVRHKGIIPWDDDIDIAMMRPDYEKFLEVAPAELGEDYELMNSLISDRYPFVTSRLMRKGTDFRSLSLKDVKCNLGIFLDIFCCDNISDSKSKRRSQYFKCFVIEKMHILRNITYPNLPYRGIVRYLCYFICLLAHIFLKLFPRKSLFRMYTKCARKYDNADTNYTSILYGLDITANEMRRDEIFPVKSVPFEDFHINIPCKYHDILTRVYGDYMTPPPDDKKSIIIPYSLDFGEAVSESK